MKTFLNSIGQLLISLLVMALITAIILFTLFSFYKSIEFLNLEEGLTKAVWTYFHFIAIFMIFWIAKTFTIIYNLDRNDQGIKKQKILYSILGIILALFISIFFSRIIDNEITNIDFTNAVYYFTVILLPLFIGFSYGFIKLSKMTKDEKWKLKKDIGKISSAELSAMVDEIQKKEWPGFDFLKKGEKCYLNRQTEDALLYFDKAFESAIIVNFATEAGRLYDLRAHCLLQLGYYYDAINDFDKSIALSPDDCNKYFSRSISKGAILDFEGEIADLQTATELSKIDNTLNREYNDEARKDGYTNGVADMFEMRIIGAQMSVDEEIYYKKKIEDASSSKDKLFWEELYNERREKKLCRIKRR